MVLTKISNVYYDMKILILRRWVPQHDPYLSHTSLQHEGTNMIVDVYGNVTVVDSMSFEFSNSAADLHSVNILLTTATCDFDCSFFLGPTGRQPLKP